MFCHFYNYSPPFSIYHYYCNYDAIKLQLLSLYPSMLTNFLNFSLRNSLLCQINYKNNCNLVTSMWCTYIFDVYYNVLKYTFGYIYRLYYIHDILNIHLRGINIYMGNKLVNMGKILSEGVED
jgi:hypothetical protein